LEPTTRISPRFGELLDPVVFEFADPDVVIRVDRHPAGPFDLPCGGAADTEFRQIGPSFAELVHPAVVDVADP
jgi:hypothetical protein